MPKKGNSSQKSQVFSISKKNYEVLDILNSIDNKSDYICEAIIEKYNCKNSENISDKNLENKIKSIIKTMVGEDLVIIQGNAKFSSVPNNVALNSDDSEKEKNEEIKEEVSEEEINDIKNIMEMM